MKTPKYIFLVLLSLFVFSSCNDLLEVNNDSVVESKNNTLSNANDSVYSVFGILSEFQKLGDSYIVMGELRGDLIDVTDSANVNLREINSLNISATNPYATVAKYYAVINNCNYVIAHMDTAVNKKALMPDYAAAVAVRAWTYYQLAINYKDVRYVETPIESVQQAKNIENYPVKTREEIFDLLIPQLQKIENQNLPAYSIGGVQVKYMIPSPKALLADIYLWKGSGADLVNAATYYKKMIESNYHYLTNEFKITYSLTSASVSSSWGSMFYTNGSMLGDEVENAIYYSTLNGNKSQLTDLFLTKYMLKPSSLSIDNWIGQSIKTTVPSLLATGDLRGLGISVHQLIYKTGGKVEPVISKSLYSNSIILSRTAYYLLRYAEAVNRLGKPTLALASLNYGLSKTFVYSSAYVNQKEMAEKPYYLNFDHARFDNTLGLRNRAGLNPVTFPTNLQTLSDSIMFVENTIVAEAGLETGFEGNRWTDLVRVALRRLPAVHPEDVKLQDPNFLGNMVARKFEANPKSYFPFTPTANASDVRSRLNADQSLWFLPFK